MAFNEQKIDQLKYDKKNVKNPKVHPYNTYTNSPGNRVSKLASRGLSPESQRTQKMALVPKVHKEAPVMQMDNDMNMFVQQPIEYQETYQSLHEDND